MSRTGWNSRSILSLAAAVLTVLGCKSTGGKSTDGTDSARESANLTWSEAKERKSRLENVRYDVSVRLNETDPTFKGTANLDFELKDTQSPVRVDFFDGRVTSIVINGQPLGPELKRKYHILLPSSTLKTGANRVKIDYEQEYTTRGQGLHRFQDPETKDVFLYTQFETYDANHFMPCFDQPDLRASLTLTVEAPRKWQVITTMREVSKAPSREGFNLWKFPATPKISTYLFSLHAGPYTVWTDRFEDLPLRLFARPALARHVRVKEWFQVTKQGLGFFNRYFDFKYPFKKYDQVFVPEFNAGAMENVAAVTFNENMLRRGALVRSQKRDQANTLLHEMAHMWFGDIVTMKWWNDLWLNESFATYMANLALSEATEFKETWQDFFMGEKSRAYWQDSLSTTHPIEAQIPTVKDAFANFDGITYSKGASVLKQWRAYLGAENFDRGIRSYIRSYAYQNAELKDFVSALQAETPLDLNLWAERWLKQSGPDKLSAAWTCEGERLKKISVTSGSTTGARFRPQTLNVGLFKYDGGAVRQIENVKVTLRQSPETVTGDWSCPGFVYPNAGDEAYGLVSLDPVSRGFASEHLSRIEDPLLRTMLWFDFWQMVRDQEVPLREYVRLIETHFPPEKDPLLLEHITDKLAGGRLTVFDYWPQDAEAQIQSRLAFTAKIEDEFLKRFQTSRPGSDEQKIWFDAYVDIARTPKALARLEAWSQGRQPGLQFKVDPDREWDLAVQLSRFNPPAGVRAVKKLLKKDGSDRGRKRALAAEAARPSAEAKRLALSKIGSGKISLADSRSVLGALFPSEQEDLTRQFAGEIYAFMKANAADDDEEALLGTLARTAAPLTCRAQESEKMKAFLSDHRDFPPAVIKTLKIGLEEDERCQRVRRSSGL